MVQGFGDMGFSLALAAIGSALGTGVAGMAAIGAWKKVFIQNKAAPFILVAFVGAPLTQTLYGYILKGQIVAANGFVQVLFDVITEESPAGACLVRLRLVRGSAHSLRFTYERPHQRQHRLPGLPGLCQ